MTESTILVVDPNPDQRTILAALLRDRGYRVFETHDPQEALTLATDESPDLILGEHPVPLPSGQALCEALQRRPETAAVPFLALTARAMPDEVDAARQSHPAGVLLKPVPVARLMAAVEAALAGRRVPGVAGEDGLTAASNDAQAGGGV